MLEILFLLSLTLVSSNDQEVLNLSLQEAKIIALENNRDIQINKKDIEISRGEVTKQKGSFDPVLSFSTSYIDAEIPTVSTFIESGTINEEIFILESGISGDLTTGTFYNLFNFSLDRTETDSPVESLSPNLTTNLSFTIGQELLRNFGKAINETPIFIAKRDVDITVDQFEDTVSDVFFNVERDYWIFVAATQNLELEKKALELALDLQNRNEIQVEVGVLPPVAVTQAKSEVATRRVDVINAENLLEQSEDRLKNRLVLPLDSSIIPVDKPKDDEVDFDEKVVLELAYENRPELKQALTEIEKSRALQRFYSNQRLPRLAVEGNLQFEGLGGDANPNRLSFDAEPEPIPDQFDEQSDAFKTLFNGDFPGWSIIGVFSYPLFNRTAKGEYIKARADLDKKTIELKKLKEQIALDIRDSLREVKNSLRRIEAARVSVELAEEVVRNEQEKLNVGLATTREVLEAQRDLIDAQTQEIRAVADYNISLAQLERARGTILEANDVYIENDDIRFNIQPK